MELALMKTMDGSFRPVTAEDVDAVARVKAGQIVRCKFTRMRNYRFFRKWWALVGFAFEYWEPKLDAPRHKGVVPRKNLDRFRRDLTILAGYYDASYRLDGSVRIEAKSISFSSMDEEEFEKLYSATIDVVLQKVLVGYDRRQLDDIVNQLLGFA